MASSNELIDRVTAVALQSPHSNTPTSTTSNPELGITYPQWFIITYNNFIFLCLLTGLVSNLFILINSFTDAKMRTTNYFFVLNLVVVDLFVILGILVIKEVAIAIQSDNFFLQCFPTVWNFVVNYSASNYILLFLCYEKFVMITLPFRKDSLLRLVPSLTQLKNNWVFWVVLPDLIFT